MSTFVEIAREYKKGWTPDKYLAGNFSNDEGTKFCFVGFGNRLKEFTQGDRIKFYEFIEEDLLHRGFPPSADMIPAVNDSDDGYAILMSLIDDILLTQAPSRTENEICRTYFEARELVAV